MSPVPCLQRVWTVLRDFYRRLYRRSLSGCIGMHQHAHETFVLAMHPTASRKRCVECFRRAECRSANRHKQGDDQEQCDQLTMSFASVLTSDSAQVGSFLCVRYLFHPIGDVTSREPDQSQTSLPDGKATNSNLRGQELVGANRDRHRDAPSDGTQLHLKQLLLGQRGLNEKRRAAFLP